MTAISRDARRRPCGPVGQTNTFVMAHLTSRWRHLTRRDAGATTIVATAIMGMAIMLLVGMGFQPGWANGWPMGISKHVVFSSFVTTIFAVVSVCSASALFIWLGFFAERIAKRAFVGWLTFLVVLLLTIVCIWLASPSVYSAVHADIVQEWP